eukprot:TRINITY_DN113384_c0_g1_i1.p2 TRINITY_DN113384_c0_g1~~TRINITY_DN113384_c0_g1_i1.p2  ORF type:complete len:270 (-),score=54.79 TRINITY_DN113384_c0_g1_i1:194-1003(-)
MDPESGAPLPSSSSGQAAEPGMMQNVIQALLARLKDMIGKMRQEKPLGVENRYYFDKDEGVWKLEGGETEEERRQSEALRFHTGRGLTTGLAPATTACDPTRAGEGAADFLPPPPTGGPIMAARVPAPQGGYVSSALSHPVYAPQGNSGDIATAGAPPPMGPPPAAARPRPVPGQPVAALQSPFAAPGAAPQVRSDPFGAAPAAAAAPLTSPFGAAAPAAAAPTPLATPFGGNLPPQPSPLAAPFATGAAPLAQAADVAAPAAAPALGA